MGVVDIRQNGFASSPQCCCKLPQFLATDCLPSSSPSEVNGVPQSYLWLLRGAATTARSEAEVLRMRVDLNVVPFSFNPFCCW